jgi:hypothetical protein
MKLSELQDILHAADPAAVLVSPRVLSRVIQEVCHLRGLLWTVPHSMSYVVDRHQLFRHVEQEELELESNQLLPDKVILLARPTDEEQGPRATPALLLNYWRLLFHAKVHFLLQQRHAEGQLTQAQLRDRLEHIGAAELQEIRTVLNQENLLTPDADERALYVEFAAVFLELCYFFPRLLHSYFPGLRDPEQTKQILAQDVDAEALFKQTRLRGAPDPGAFRSGSPDEAYEYYHKLILLSERAAQQNNLVRAATLRRRAARVAPTPLAFSTRNEAVAYLQKLLQRLQVALQLTDAEAAEWLKDLPTLLDRADQGRTPVEATLLYDLQATCLEYERDLYALDVIEWALSAGRRPIKRPLPSQRMVRVMKQLRVAVQRLTLARLAEEDRQHFGNLLQAALHKCEERLRTSFRPVLSTALYDVGLRPTNPLEQTAFHKVIEEILDRISANGFLTFGDLRDTISRNQLKLPDVGTPQEYIRGDPLLRLDRRLATLLDGVYRPSEVYLRILERMTALMFGTFSGRFLTQYVLIPLGGAFLAIEVANLLLKLLHDVNIVHEAVMLAPWHYTLNNKSVPEVLPWLYYPSLALLAAFAFGLWHRPVFRRRVSLLGWDVLVALRRLFLDVPVSLVQVPALRWFVSSWAFQLCYWYLFKPVVIVLLLWLCLPMLPEAYDHWLTYVVVFIAAAVVVNSRIGRALNEVLNQTVLRVLQLLRAGLLVGLVRLVTQVFQTVVDAVEYVLFVVDEYLRFRTGDTRLSLVVRLAIGVVWFPISYLARFYMLVLIEPGFNPLKFPISTIAAKFLYPLIILLDLRTQLEPVIGSWLYWGVVAPTMFLLPDAVAFIIWETKGNWGLYRATRPRTIRPVPVGGHGETIPALLRPGFHSGTVPRYYTRLRAAERAGLQSGNWSAARTWRHHLEEVEEAVRQFATRELAYLINQSTSWQARPLRVGRVTLASNRVLVELLAAGPGDRPCWLEFEDARGWLVAHIAELGFLEHLTGAQARALNTALASLYKLAGVDLVREQLAANLPEWVAAYDIVPDGLMLWLDQRHGEARFCDLRRNKGLLRAPDEVGEPPPGQERTVLDVRGLLFADAPLSWQQCLESWQRDPEGKGQPPLVCGGQELLLLGKATPSDVEKTVLLMTGRESSAAHATHALGPQQPIRPPSAPATHLKPLAPE